MSEQPKAPIGLKILVFVLALAIVGMLVLIIFKLINGDHQKKGEDLALKETGIATVTPQGAPLAKLGGAPLVIDAPEGTKLVDVQLSSGQTLMRFEGSTETILIILDNATGESRQITIGAPRES